MTADPYPGRAVVLYDGRCALCQRSAAVLRRLDWLGRLAYHDARDAAGLPPTSIPLDPRQLLAEMHVVTPDRTAAPAGFRAVRWMAWRFPLTVVGAPFLYLPGMQWLGTRLYRWVARNRFDLVPCHDGACHVPLHSK